jgi:hypothetical protein
LVQAFVKKWWVESDFKAPNLPLSFTALIDKTTPVKYKITTLIEKQH